MFRDSKAFNGFAVDDLEQARAFYGETLGLDIGDAPMGLLSLELTGGRPTLIYPKPDFVPATYTILNFPVSDVDAAVDHLESRGVQLERYEGLHQDERGIARGKATNNGPDIAWFKDPAGNVLSVLSED